jgi:hypothetical protein
MSPLEKLYRLEIEFHRRLRTEAPGPADTRALHPRRTHHRNSPHISATTWPTLTRPPAIRSARAFLA